MPSDTEDDDIKSITRRLHNISNELRKIQGLPDEPLSTVEPEPPFCSFCGKGKNQVNVLVEGPQVFICDECVALAQGIIQDIIKAAKRTP